MRQVILAAVLSAMCGAASAEEDTNLYWRVFAIPNEGGCGCPGGHKDESDNKENNYREVIRFLCTNSLTTWPAGSVITLANDPHDQLIIRNTRENIKKFENYYYSIMGRPDVIEVEMTALAVRRQDVESLSAKEGVTCEALMALRSQGLCKQVAFFKGFSRHSSDFQRGDFVQDITIPSELRLEVVTNGNDTAVALVPANFETVSFGYQPEVYASMLADGKTIHARVEVNNTILLKWDTFDSVVVWKGEKNLVSFRRPIVDRSHINANTSLLSGETVLLGGGGDESREWFTYHLLKATSIRKKDAK